MNDGIYPVTVPKWGIEMLEGTVVRWHVPEGNEIARGDELIDIETDKIVNTMEAPSSGVLRRCLVGEGETLKVGSLLGVIAPTGLEDSAIDQFVKDFRPAANPAGDQDEAKAPAGVKAPPAPQPAPSPEPSVSQASQKVRVSPAAARLARELGVDIGQVTGSGRRITPEDVERFASQRQAGNGAAKDSDADGPAYEAQPLSATRKTIARRLVEAKQQIPHFYLSIDINMEAALAKRNEINSQSAQKVSVNDIVMRSAVLALKSVPDVNIHLVQEEIRRFRQVNLAMAVATERGIVTPVLHQAESMTVQELAKQAAALGEKARNASLTREELENGTFTVSNLGMYGVHEFQAIINPPQGAILALGVCEKRIVPGIDAAETASMMRVTLSCDHRAIDGALGAQFLSKLKGLLENPQDL